MQTNKTKWIYVLKTALLFSFIQANLIQLIRVILADLTFEYETTLLIIGAWILGAIALTIFLFPIGIFFGLYLWKNSKKGRLLGVQPNNKTL
ncbi:hypothetical protein [Bacillus sp. FJAT-29937]|uniref:hypothetical protein n=1 Tax=Bacillus sp. FJAT-29937 TaxID=1720553 RepID=UPI00082A506F|nr:hypothetical protein [Bacillus sp. FJAT-29937]